MTALEIRPEEIGQFDLAAYRARRARFAQPVIKQVATPTPATQAAKPAPVDLAETLYMAPIGPERPRYVLLEGAHLNQGGDAMRARKRTRYFALKNRPRHHLDAEIYPFSIGPARVLLNEVVRDVLLIASVVLPEATAAKILDEVCTKYGVTAHDVLGPWRQKDVKLARQEVMWRLRKETKMSFPQIGRFVGGRDHTTAMHGYQAHEARLTGIESRRIQTNKVRSRAKYLEKTGGGATAACFSLAAE